MIANNGLNAGVVLPLSEGAMPADLDDVSAALEVRLNGKLLDSGPLWGFGSPAAAISWLQDDLRHHGLALEPGHLILTGTALGLHPVRPGDRLEVSAGRFGAVSMAVTG